LLLFPLPFTGGSMMERDSMKILSLCDSIEKVRKAGHCPSRNCTDSLDPPNHFLRVSRRSRSNQLFKNELSDFPPVNCPLHGGATNFSYSLKILWRLCPSLSTNIIECFSPEWTGNIGRPLLSHHMIEYAARPS
jgi:hypothetical protein